MQHIFINENSINETTGSIVVDDKEIYNHLVKSVRINLNEEIYVSKIPFDIDYSYKATVEKIDANSIICKIVEKAKSNELKYNLNLYQGIPKNDKLELIVEKAVELGAYSIIPIDMEFCIKKLDNKQEKYVERLRKIAYEAANQSKRNIIPEIKLPQKYKSAIQDVSGKDNTINIMCYENEVGISGLKNTINDIKVNNIKNINIFVGPEGGISEKELNLAKENGVKIVSLGDRILRTETAGITILSILMYELS